MARLRGLTAMVTGASSGLGRAIALQFASHGAKLVVCADLKRRPQSQGESAGSKDTVETITERFGQDKALFTKVDVSNSSDVEDSMHLMVEKSGRIDILVNCAGLGNVSGSPLLHELNEADWNRVLDVNLKGTFLTNKFALRQMMRQTPKDLPSSFGYNIQCALPKRRGNIINVSSMLGSIALPDGTAAYCASKGGVLNLTRQAALDYAPYLININALCPGFLETAMTAGNRKDAEAMNQVRPRQQTAYADQAETGERMRCATPFGEWGKVDDVARMAVSLASEDAAWMTGAEVVVDGGYSAGGFGGVSALRDPRTVRYRQDD